VSALASPRRRRRAPGLPGADGGGLDAARHAWWGELRHGGLLLATALLDELLPEERALHERAYDRLRTAWLAFDAALYGAGAIDTARREFARALWEDFLGLCGWERGSAIRPEHKATAATGERLRPDWVLPDGDAAPLVLLVFDDADRLGVGRGRRAHARLVELLRATGAALGVLTNGRQLRLVHAGPDFDAWAEWDAQTWFDEGPGRETLRGLAALLGERGEGDYAAVRRLIAAIRDSRARQGDLAQVLGEQVRRAVEGLVTEADRALAADPALRDALWTDPRTGHTLRDDDAHHALYQAATRVVMRLVLLLYAEARDLLPASVEAYHDSYGVEALYRTLHEAAQEGADSADHQGAWLRLLALFRLVYDGSPHPDLPVRAYGGQLFRPGDRGSHDATLRALAVLEESRPSDASVARLLRLLKVGKVKVRAGRGARWVAGAVDFGSLRTEYIGIVYEGLLDYELRRAPANDPIVVLDVGRQPSLPLSRLRGLGPVELKELLKAFKKDASKAAGAGDAGEEDADAEEVAGEAEAAAEAEEGGEDEPAEDAPAPEPAEVEAGEAARELDARTEALAWAREAAQLAGLVRKGRRGGGDPTGREREIDKAARRLLGTVIPPGRLYLVASGGLRKGSGSFYTRPALSVPLVHRTLEPLCYERDGDRLVPRTPAEILALKVCEPAMGSGSFLVGALRYLVEALARSLEHHGKIRPVAEREVIVTLPFGEPARGREEDELLPLPREDDRFPQALRARLARHVVERCLYGVDRNPMAVELARLALWLETLDRDLPFEYLDHKLKVGDSLVGCWLHLVDDYPVRALDREGGDGAKGERTKWLGAQFKAAKQQLPDLIRKLGGASTFFDEVALPPADLVARVRVRFEALHDLDRDERERAYAELLASDEYRALKRAMDTWCALWFWPAGDDRLPLPRDWGEPSEETLAVAAELADHHRFFHWELEFPDVFRPDRAGFDAVLGNPPWEIAKPNSQEFFSRLDPLYRTYGKTEALARQAELFAGVPGLEDEWIAYQAQFKSLTGWVRAADAPFDVSLGAGKAAEGLAAGWAERRRGRAHLAGRDHPFRLQGSADLNTYKMFLEAAHHLARDGGRLGFLVPSGIYTDKGAAELRRTFLEKCRWEWCYGFENRHRVFPIDSRFKFVPLVIQRGGSTEVLHAAFMRHDVAEWERPDGHVVELRVEDIRRFAPKTWSFLELKGDRDLEIVERVYAEHPLLGEVIEREGAHYSSEFHMTNAAKHFTSRARLVKDEVLGPDDDLRDPRARARLRVAGYLPLYEGKSLWTHDPYFVGRPTARSVSYAVRVATVQRELEDDAWATPRLVYRSIASSTNQRTLVAALMPSAVHGNSGHSLDGLGAAGAVVARLNSLITDYVVRMKVSANLNWFYMETLPIADAPAGSPFAARAADLVWRLNAIGADFPHPAADPLIDPADRLAARLELDALVADLYGLRPDDLGHIAAQFPIYDSAAPPEHRYPTLALDVFRVMHAEGPDAARARASKLAERRRAAGVGFGLDELWVPAGGWAQANAEAREILAAAGEEPAWH